MTILQILSLVPFLFPSLVQCGDDETSALLLYDRYPCWATSLTMICIIRSRQIASPRAPAQQCFFLVRFQPNHFLVSSNSFLISRCCPPLRSFLFTKPTPCFDISPGLPAVLALHVLPLFPKGRLPQPHTTTLNLDTGKATRACITPQPPKEGLDFPQLRQTLTGKKNRRVFSIRWWKMCLPLFVLVHLRYLLCFIHSWRLGGQAGQTGFFGCNTCGRKLFRLRALKKIGGVGGWRESERLSVIPPCSSRLLSRAENVCAYQPLALLVTAWKVEMIAG